MYFTSYNDQTIGLDTNPYVTSPVDGDWGGIEFRSDVDRTQGYFQWSDEGVFLNYVNHADIRYGGGSVLINSVPRVINPIHMTDARPTVTYNTISQSADASMSASPDSFEETNFHAPRNQRIAFTSDYSRIGPEIHHNNLIDNSVNGLFVRVGTEAGSTAQKLNVSGRWDDTDIVHVLSENLAIAAQPGGAIDRDTAPPVVLVMTAAYNDGSDDGRLVGQHRDGRQVHLQTDLRRPLRLRESGVDGDHQDDHVRELWPPSSGRCGSPSCRPRRTPMWLAVCTAARTTGRSCSSPN